MLCFISYDLKGDDKNYQSLYDKIDSLGVSYRSSESTVFLRTDIDAGLVDAAIRSVVDEDAIFVVMDITGIEEEKYFGRVSSRTVGENFWKWIKDNNY